GDIVDGLKGSDGSGKVAARSAGDVGVGGGCAVDRDGECFLEASSEVGGEEQSAAGRVQLRQKGILTTHFSGLRHAGSDGKIGAAGGPGDVSVPSGIKRDAKSEIGAGLG